jgi:hypothetical protein
MSFPHGVLGFGRRMGGGFNVRICLKCVGCEAAAVKLAEPLEAHITICPEHFQEQQRKCLGEQESYCHDQVRHITPS